jgi:phage terminase large subunit-like protein
VSERKARAARQAAAHGRAALDEAIEALFEDQADLESDALNLLDADEREQFLKLMKNERLIRRGKAIRKKSFRQFIDYVTNGRFKWYRYAVVLCDVLQKVVDGKLKRVIINAPPRHGKSEPASRLLPAYFLYRHPQKWVALLSYGAELAQTLSRSARANYAAGVGLISKEAAAMRQWETGKGGGLWATGFGGPGLGKGFDLGIIDDPYKSAEEAASPTMRATFRDWYASTFYTRAEPDAAIVIIMQRWDEEDLCGWLLDQEYALAADELIKQSAEDLRAKREADREADRQGFMPEQLGDGDGDPADDDLAEHWHIVNFEALRRSDEEIAEEEAERGKPRFPPTCTVEPDWREVGEALAPERYSAKRLRMIRARIGEYFFGALYQQNPRARSGGMFDIDALQIIDDVDLMGAQFVRYWDFATTDAKTADFTVGLLMARTRGGAYVVIDVVRGQWAQAKRDAMIVATAEIDRDTYGAVTIWGEIEAGSGGIDQAAAFRKLLESHKVFTEHPTGSKSARAQGLATTAAKQKEEMGEARAEIAELRKIRAEGLSSAARRVGNAGGNLYALRAGWNAVVRKELLDFPKGRHDDIVDAMSGAYNKLARNRRIALAPSHSA